MSVRIMVIEDEKEIREEYRMLIHSRPTLQLVAETADIDEALEVLESTSIDAILLDLELPTGSGILFLEKMKQLDIEKPFIAVVTNVVSKVIYDTIRHMGVDYICAKGDKDFSLNVPLSIIEISAPYQKTKHVAKSISKKVNRRTMIDIYERCVDDELMRLGFKEKMSGGNYCKHALLYIIMSDDMNVSVTKDVYPYVASQCNTNVANVERNIRIAIEKVWTSQDIRKIRELYPYEWNDHSGRPSNAEFLFHMANKIIRQ